MIPLSILYWDFSWGPERKIIRECVGYISRETIGMGKEENNTIVVKTENYRKKEILRPISAMSTVFVDM